MKIIKEKMYFVVHPETPTDCDFIEYIESASEIMVGGKSGSYIGESYRITKIRIMNSVPT